MAFKTATVNSSKVAATLSNYPTYIDLTRVKGSAMTQAEADSVRIYTDSAKTTEIAREIVSVSECHAKIPSLTTTTQIWVDYDGSRSDYAATDTYGRNAVWSDYEIVLHKQSTSSIVESTGNYTFTISGGVTAVASVIGNGFSYNGSNGHMAGSGSAPGISNVTFTSWVRPGALTGSNYRTVMATEANANRGYGFRVKGDGANSGKLQLYYGNNSNYNDSQFSTGTIAINTNSYVAATLSGTTVAYYIAGATSGTTSTSGSPVTFGAMYTGALRAGSSFFDRFNGVIDESRFRLSTLSANWITTEYNNQSDEATFWGTWTDAGGAPVANNGFQLWWA